MKDLDPLLDRSLTTNWLALLDISPAYCPLMVQAYFKKNLDSAIHGMLQERIALKFCSVNYVRFKLRYQYKNCRVKIDNLTETMEIRRKFYNSLNFLSEKFSRPNTPSNFVKETLTKRIESRTCIARKCDLAMERNSRTCHSRFKEQLHNHWKLPLRQPSSQTRSNFPFTRKRHLAL